MQKLMVSTLMAPFLVIVFSFSLNAQCYNLVWSDEFDDTSIDLTKWEFQTGAGGWGNNELQHYTNRTNNAVEENGVLKIIAREENFNGADYTSARLHTKNLAEWTFGKFEARMKLPEGQGLWPAFWMLPTENVYGIWPFSGEIDIMELLGHQPNKTYGTIHTWGNSAPFSSGANFTLPTGTFSEIFHVFAIEWEPSEIRWYIDGMLYATKTPADFGPYFWPFIQNFHLLLNVAVGGDWPNPPDATTVFPQTMEIDYVRIYQELSDLQITGLEMAEPNSTQTYELPNLPGASYNWTVPAGATIIGGQNTPSITVNWGTSGGFINAVVTNTCGSEMISMEVVITSNLFLNPDFEEDYSFWDTRTHNGSNADFEIELVNPAQGVKAACVTANDLGVGGHTWSIQLSRPNLNLLPEPYSLTFQAKSDINGRAISLAFIDSDDFTLLDAMGMTLSDTWTTKNFIFTPTTANTITFNIDLAFEMGSFCFDDFQFARLAALPVSWLGFTATAIDPIIDLNWSTASETNSDFYEIQRSDTGIDFRSIGTTKGGGSTNEISTYHFIDKTPLIGTSYYRLKQVDFDGTYSFSKIVQVSLADPNKFQIYPNPVTDQLTFERNTVDLAGIIQIYNSTGQLLKEEKIQFREKLVNINISQLEQGVYWLKYADQKTQESIRFIKR